MFGKQVSAICLILLSSVIAKAATKCIWNEEQVTLQQIEKIIQDCAPLDLFSISAGQYVNLETTQVVDVSLPLIIAQRLDQVRQRNLIESGLELDFSISLNELQDNGYWNQSRFLQSILVPYENVSHGLPQSLKRNGTETLISNFKSKYGMMSPPATVSGKPDCGGLKDCAKGIRYLKLNFDAFFLQSDHQYRKVSYDMIFSPDIPNYVEDWRMPEFLRMTNLLKLCSLQMTELTQDGNVIQVPIQQCNEVKDFQFGIHE